MRPDFHILIIGGGMVGACVAALVASDRRLADLRVAVLDANPPAAPPDEGVDLRVSALSRASERILSSVDAWRLIPPQYRSAYTDMRVWDAGLRPESPGSIHFSASATSEPDLGHIVENRRVRWALFDAAVFRDRVTVLRGELAALEFGPEQATVTLSDGRRIAALLVVGSDGAGSSSRTLAGIESAGWDYDQHAFVTHVRTARPHERTAWQRFLSTGPIAFLPLTDGRSSIVWSTRPEQARELCAAPPEEAAAQVEAAIDGVLGAVEIAGPRGSFPLRLKHARSYCREQFVLVGDAAHAVHPLAGQGVNLGLLDAATLVQVLGDAVAASGRADAIADLRALRRYERWRKSENVLALGLIDGINRVFSTSNPALGFTRRLALSAVDRSALAKRFFMGRAMGVRGELPRAARPPGVRI